MDHDLGRFEVDPLEADQGPEDHRDQAEEQGELDVGPADDLVVAGPQQTGETRRLDGLRALGRGGLSRRRERIR